MLFLISIFFKGSIKRSSPIISQKIPHLLKLIFISSNLSLSFTLSSPRPLKILGELANEAAIYKIGYSSIINLANSLSSSHPFKVDVSA